jgi:hypothetical protein
MLRFCIDWFSNRSSSSSRRQPSRQIHQMKVWSHRTIWLGIISLGLVVILVILPMRVAAQGEESLQQREDQLIRDYTLPPPSAPAPVLRPRPTPAQRSDPPRPAPTAPSGQAAAPAPAPSEADLADDLAEETADETADDSQPTFQYTLNFDRSPIVGNRLRLAGVYPEARLGFTRPRDWELQTVKALLRYQHAPGLLADRSSLTLRVNNTSVGSVRLNRPDSQIGEAIFNIPVSLIQDENELSLVAEQQTSETCTNPADPSLWTEILPDSKLVFDFQPQPITLDLSRYPYPFIDRLSLDPNQISQLRPQEYDDQWLTAAGRFQASLGRLAEFSKLETQLVDDLDSLGWGDRLVVIGTPNQHPILDDLSLPVPLRNGQFLDGDNRPLPADVGILMLTTAQDGRVPILIATGNSPQGVAKAVQDLVQPGDRDILAGQAAIIDRVAEVSTPEMRQWPGYLPADHSFRLSDLTVPGGQPFRDVTVYGSEAPPIRINFRALPDDQFSRGSTMTLHYSHSPQVNPRTSLVEVRLDDGAIASKRLSARRTDTRHTFQINLPDDLIKPDSELSVQFVLYPRDSQFCGLVTDNQLWGRVYGDTSFNLNRNNVVTLPDLELLKTGYPLTEPQDLSATALVLPERPTDDDVKTMLAVSRRLGQLSTANSVKLNAYRAGMLPGGTRTERHVVGIGRRDRFPLQDALRAESFSLQDGWTRIWQGSRVHALPDEQGVVREILSPQNGDRVILALTAQTDQGLTEIQDLFSRDDLFTQLHGDTVLVGRNEENPSLFEPSGYTLTFLQEASTRRIERVDSLSRISLFLQDYWFMLPTGIVFLSILLYGISQLYLNRLH